MNKNLLNGNKKLPAPYALQAIELDPDCEITVRNDKMVEVEVLEVRLLPELFNISLETHPDTYFVSVAVIDPFKKEVLEVMNHVGGNKDLNGEELPIKVIEPEYRVNLYELLRQNTDNDFVEEFDEICKKIVENEETNNNLEKGKE